MRARELMQLLNQTARLTPGQREQLMAHLSTGLALDQATAIVQGRMEQHPGCPKCQAQRVARNGQADGLQRYKCRSCGATFNALTGTPLAQLHRRDAWLDYARALVDRVSLKVAAERADICLGTSFLWRHRFLEVAEDRRPSAVTGLVEVDETFILKSAKGSRKLVGRAPRNGVEKPGSLGSRPTSTTLC